MNLRTVTLAIPLCLSLFADDVSISGPTMGLVYSGGSLRLVVGIPGAAYVGSALPLDVTPDLVAIAPEQTYALARSAGKWSVIDASRSKLVSREVPGAADAASVWFSPAGKSALLLAADGLHAQLLTGMPALPVVTASFALTDVAALAAISEDGRFALTASASGVISQWDGDGNLRGAVPLGDVSALQFYNRSGDALAASRSTRQIYKLRESGDIVPVMTLEASAVATSSDDAIILALAADGSIQTMSASGDVATYIPPLPATRLLRMGGVLRLNDYCNGPLLIFDGSQVMMIPPAKDGGDQ